MEAEPLLRYIEENKERIIGQRICNFYRDNFLNGISDGPAVFEFEQFSLIIHYYWYSDLTIYVVDPKKVHNDLSLNFLYKDIPESRNVRYWVQPLEFPYIGRRISSVEVERFSEKFESNPSTGGIRPDGGDYFSKITIHLDDSRKFFICAEDAMFDGYMTIWD